MLHSSSKETNNDLRAMLPARICLKAGPGFPQAFVMDMDSTSLPYGLQQAHPAATNLAGSLQYPALGAKANRHEMQQTC